MVLIGPRQVGKTTLAQEVAAERDAVYVDLERPSDLAKLSDVEQYCAENADRLVVLDEVHRAPGLFAPLRGIIDRRRLAGKRAGMFLLLGSASVELLRQSGETLAGRVAQCELHPFGATEVAADTQRRLWCRGGLPDSFLAPDDAESLDWRISFIRMYLERDVPQLGPRIPAETLRRFWTMLAHNQGQTHNAAALARGLDVNGVTIARYLDLLVDLLLVRRLQPWTSNLGRRLVKAPKVYIRDSGVRHALLGIETVDDLLGHPVVGGSWEGFVIENVAAVLPARASFGYYRTAGGAEVDLVVDHGRGRDLGGGDQAELRAPGLPRIPQRVRGPPAHAQVRGARRRRELPAREGHPGNEPAGDGRARGRLALTQGITVMSSAATGPARESSPRPRPPEEEAYVIGPRTVAHRAK